MKQDTPGQPNINMVSSGTTISGSLETKSDLRISGTVEGQIYAESKCIVSESGLVKGDLKTKEADIAGTVDGELIVSNRLILRSSAKISGDITTKVLMVEEGARIDGACRMGDKIDLTKSSSLNNGSVAKDGNNTEKSSVNVASNNR